MWCCEDIDVVCGIRVGNVYFEQLSDRSTDTYSHTHIIISGWVLSSREVILDLSDLIGFLVWRGNCLVYGVAQKLVLYSIWKAVRKLKKFQIQISSISVSCGLLCVLHYFSAEERKESMLLAQLRINQALGQYSFKEWREIFWWDC